MVNEIETIILTATQSIYDACGWLGVAALLTFENVTDITPSECPNCGESVRFDEIHTRTHKNLPEGKKKVSVVVLRCPECKRIAGTGILPFEHQRKET